MKTENQPFVGREKELAALHALVQQGANGSGGLALIEGEAGMGKSELLAALQANFTRQPESAQAHFVIGHCDEWTSQNAYQPLAEMLSAFLKNERRGLEIGKVFLTIIKETGPDWLQIIPGIGPAVSAGLKTATLAGQLLVNGGDRAVDSANLNSQYLNTILRLAAKLHPLVLVIEDAHWIDESSSQLLLQLSRSLHASPLIVFLTYRPSFITGEHPLTKVQSVLQSRGQATMVRLGGLSEEQIQGYVIKRFGNTLQPNLARWVTHLCGGNPLFVTQYLSLLEQEQIIRVREGQFMLEGRLDLDGDEWNLSENIPIPDSVEMLLDQRIQRLLADDQHLLQQAAVLGETFMSSILANLLQAKEMDILPRLRVLVDEHRLIRYGQTSEQWTDERAEVYAFEHMLMHMVFYGKLSPRERVLYHREVAEILSAALLQDPNPNRRLVLEAARHYDFGDQPGLAAQHYMRAARTSFADGAFPETVSLCKKTTANLDRLRQLSPAEEQLQSEAIQTLLLASEAHWHGKTEASDGLDLEELAEQAESAALRSGDQGLIAQARFLHGHILLVTRNFPDALAKMESALELARQGDNLLLEFAILSRYGHEMVGHNMARGVEILAEAHNLYETRLAQDPPPGIKVEVLARSYHRLQSLIGVAEFDRGDHDRAMDWLQKSIAGLKPLKMRDYLLGPYNFLAQVYIASGLFEQAEALLLEAIALFAEDEDPNAWNAYNLGLLGKLYLEWERPEQAGEVLTKGWQHTQATWYVAMALLVKNYYAELLMEEKYSGYNPEEADLICSETVSEGRATGSHRSAIAALTLRSKLALAQGRPEPALDYSTEAFEYLYSMGMTLPALRTEEVLFQHAQALAANGQKAEAREQREAAYQVIQEKAAAFSNDQHRQSFQTRIPLNRAILAAME